MLCVVSMVITIVVGADLGVHHKMLVITKKDIQEFKNR